MIEAFARIAGKFKKTKLIIAGEGPYRTTMESKIHELGLKDRVFLLGVRKDIPILHAISTIFVFPTYLEGLPGSLVEAMMTGKIIICSDIAENLECVSEKEVLIFPTGDVNIMAKTMSVVLENPSNFKQFQKNAIEQGRLKFEIKEICKKYTEYYKSIIDVTSKSKS